MQNEPPGFLDLPFIGSTVDGKNWIVIKCPPYRDRRGRVYKAKIGSTTDGPSVPESARIIITPFGIRWLAGVIHDAAYRNTLEMLSKSGEWRHIDLTRDMADDLFKEILEVVGCSREEVTIFYEAVHIFGMKAYKEDRNI